MARLGDFSIRIPQSEIRNCLIVFTRYPEPGESKTRLIPALGPRGAADLHRKMTEHTLSWARKWRERFPASLEIHFTGGREESFQEWLGRDLSFRAQPGGNLGVRMQEAFRQAFQEGAEKVVIVGTDCPELTEDLTQEAFAGLDQGEVALGPAKDGGYYLIGLRRPVEELFRGIPWGTAGVLARTLEAAQRLDLRVFLLMPLDDVDRPEDLPIWEKFSGAPFLPSPLPVESLRVEREGEALPCGVMNLTPQGKGGAESASISIIIPTLDEEENIAACLAGCRPSPNTETIIVDGGSRDRTAEIARSCGATVIQSAPVRARQMNAGADAATGDLLLFLHADTRLPRGFAHSVRQILSLPGVLAGAFEFRLDAVSPGLRLVERVTNWRSRFLQLPYGDQAIFIRSELFREVGGFPDLPIMEDFAFIRRIKKKRKGRVHTASLPAVTSARRWRALGVWKTTLINQLIILAYYLGIPPTRLKHWARRDRRGR
jgi:rSAM/selenodomain-associated transferase 2/rSAM/selenodomain-associated transferase 1